ncbi:unnamed protein product [Acanthoscelides obtectus]|uniref:Uncharacterized protein n=1 Tax=Acanthoscelides obtectus TaxID=200917 RepID=A0A9P0LYL3_ACAOB|nr:unnamed protein product [Acanthoscelides obtectus]CAK1650039.1 hypothetical protein AOBTE_LOCUS16563 [Acanthoscelides obtectus]
MAIWFQDSYMCITPIAVGNLYMLYHIRLIHSFDCATMLFTTLSTDRDTVA